MSKRRRISGGGREWKLYTTEDIAAGRKLVAEIGSHQWALGDLALKVAPMGDDHARNGSGEVIDQFADEIGISGETLREYRRVSAAYPDGARAPSASYTLHRELAGHPKREEVLAAYLESTPKPSYRGLQKFLGKRPTPEISAGNRGEQVRQALTEMPHSERAAVIRDVLTDPATADAVVRVEETRKAIHAADSRHSEEVLKTAGFPDGKLELSPQDRFARWSLTELDMDLLLMARKLKAMAKALSSRTAPIPPQYQEDMLSCIQDMRTSLDFAESAISRETADWDAALSELGEA